MPIRKAIVLTFSYKYHNIHWLLSLKFIQRVTGTSRNLWAICIIPNSWVSHWLLRACKSDGMRFFINGIPLCLIVVLSAFNGDKMKYSFGNIKFLNNSILFSKLKWNYWYYLLLSVNITIILCNNKHYNTKSCKNVYFVTRIYS